MKVVTTFFKERRLLSYHLGMKWMAAPTPIFKDRESAEHG
jgi:hypothetical protein